MKTFKITAPLRNFLSERREVATLRAETAALALADAQTLARFALSQGNTRVLTFAPHSWRAEAI